jgi:hypothetical protein
MDLIQRKVKCGIVQMGRTKTPNLRSNSKAIKLLEKTRFYKIGSLF